MTDFDFISQNVCKTITKLENLPYIKRIRRVNMILSLEDGIPLIT